MTEEQALLRREVAELCAKEVVARALDDDRRGKPPIELLAKLAQLGFCGVAVPEAQGGAGMGPLAVVIVLEEVARVFPSLALSLAAQTIVGMAIAECGDSQLQAEFAPLVTSGREMAAVSLVQDVLVGARPREAVALRGQLRFMVNGLFASLFLAAVEVDGGRQWAICRVASGGCAVEPLEALGFRASGLATLVCDGVPLAAGQLFQQDGTRISLWRGLCLSAIAVGICQGAVDHSSRYARERQQFGKPIAEFDMVRRLLGDAVRRATSARLMTYDAATRMERGSTSETQLLQALTWSREAAMLCADNAVQVFGGYGYTKDYPAEMFFRDAKFLETTPPSVSEARCAEV
ncbi:MAG: acyl-CoA dehydrogenase family protein [Calditrichaeota bacterium]|nr:acyl-CoA dehydrogenase family protein [Calditrichota bacterium]